MRLAAVLLAAGAGRRMGSAKLEALKDGRPALSHALHNLLQAPVEAIIVVASPTLRLAGAPETANPMVRVVINQRPEDGLSGSLRRGVEAVPGEFAGIFIALGDMPQVGAMVYARLASAFREAGGTRLVAPYRAGRRGNPLLVPAAWARTAVIGLQGDRGFGPMLESRDQCVIACEADDDGVLLDLDRPADLARWRSS